MLKKGIASTLSPHSLCSYCSFLPCARFGSSFIYENVIRYQNYKSNEQLPQIRSIIIHSKKGEFGAILKDDIMKDLSKNISRFSSSSCWKKVGYRLTQHFPISLSRVYLLYVIFTWFRIKYNGNCWHKFPWLLVTKHFSSDWPFVVKVVEVLSWNHGNRWPGRSIHCELCLQFSL